MAARLLSQARQILAVAASTRSQPRDDSGHYLQRMLTSHDDFLDCSPISGSARHRLRASDPRLEAGDNSLARRNTPTYSAR